MANDEKVLNTKLTWSMDPASHEGAVKRIKTLKELYKELDEVQKKGVDELKKGEEANLILVKKLIAEQSVLLDKIEDIESAEKSRNAEAEKTLQIYKRQQQELIRLSGVMNRVSSSMGQGSVRLLAGGLATTGGIFALGSSYVKNAEKSDSITRRWLATQKEIEESQMRMGRVAATTVLPIYEQLSNLAVKISNVIEKHPELVKVAFGAGAAMSLIGLLGMAVSKGIKLVADITYVTATANQLLAAKMMNGAADKQLAAAGISGKGAIASTLAKGGSIIAGSGALTVAGTVTATLAVIAAGTAVGVTINNILAKAGVKGFIPGKQFATGAAYEVGNVLGKVTGLSPEETQRKSTVFAAIIGKLTGAIDEASPIWQKALTGLQRASEKVSGGVAGSQYEEQIVEAYEDMLNKELEITRDIKKEVEKVLSDYQKAVSKTTSDHYKNLADINKKASKETSSVMSQYAANEKKAIASYNEQRSKIASSGGEEIVKIEADLQEKLKKLEEERDRAVDEAARNRDALALVKAERAYEDQRIEEEQNSLKEIQQRRRETAIRLQELARDFAAQRQQRIADMQARVAEIRANAAEQRQVENDNFKSQLQELKDNKDEQLRLLETQKREELQKNRSAFLQQVRDLDASLLGEKQLRQRRYAEMLADVDKFLGSYKARLSGSATDKIATAVASGGVKSTNSGFSGSMLYRSEGGYVSGLVKTGEKGYEYVLSNKTVKLAESMLGTKLTQESFVNMLMKANKGNNVYVNDYRRMEHIPPAWERNMMNKETMDMLQGLFS